MWAQSRRHVGSEAGHEARLRVRRCRRSAGKKNGLRRPRLRPDPLPVELGRLGTGSFNFPAGHPPIKCEFHRADIAILLACPAARKSGIGLKSVLSTARGIFPGKCRGIAVHFVAWLRRTRLRQGESNRKEAHQENGNPASAPRAPGPHRPPSPAGICKVKCRCSGSVLRWIYPGVSATGAGWGAVVRLPGRCKGKRRRLRSWE